MCYFARIGRITLKRFRAIALTTFLIVMAAASELHISPSVQARAAQVNQSQVSQAQVNQSQVSQAQVGQAQSIEIAQAQPAKPSNPANVVLDWNVTALTVAASPPVPAPQQYRSVTIADSGVDRVSTQLLT